MTETEIPTEAAGTVVDSVEATEAEPTVDVPAVEASAETIVETTVPVASDEKTEAFQALADAANKFREARSKVDAILLGAPVEVKPIAESEPVDETPAAEASVETEPVIEAPAVDETASVEMAEMKEAIALAASAVAGAADQLVAIAGRVSELETGLLSAKAEKAELEAQVEDLKSKIVSTEDAEKTALSAAILELDSETDPELLKGMTVQALSSYRDGLVRVAGKTKGFDKRSVKADETAKTESTALGAPKEETKAEFIKNSLIPLLKTSERKQGGLF